MSLRNVYDPRKKTKNLLTTIPGLIGLVVTILLGVNLISQEQSAVLQQNLNIIFDSGVAIVTGITSIIAIFKATD